MPNLTVLRNLSSHDAQCLRAASEVGIFPTRVIPGFIETFCVAALEYEALGVPVLASSIGGVPEAVPDGRFLVAPGTTAARMAGADRRGAGEPGRAQRGRGRVRRKVHQRAQRPAAH